MDRIGHSGVQDFYAVIVARRTMCYWRKICEKIKYLEIEKRYGHAVSGILKLNGSPLKENYWLRDIS